MNAETCEQLRNEMRAVLNRYTHESDMTVSEAVATLELMKADVIEDWHARHRNPRQEND